jgi:hypothetical protein
MKFDARRWTGFEIAAGAATLVLLFSLFEPWYGVHLVRCPGGFCQASGLLEASGISAHGYLWAALVAALTVLVALLLRALDRTSFFKSPNYRQLVAGLSGLNLVLALLALFNKPGLVYSPIKGSPDQVPLPLFVVDVKYGTWIAVVTASVAFLAASINVLRQRRALVPPASGTDPVIPDEGT